MNRPIGTIKKWIAKNRKENSPDYIKKNATKGSLKMQENYALKRQEAYDLAKFDLRFYKEIIMKKNC